MTGYVAQLKQLQSREFLLRLAWGITRFLAFTVLVVATACLIDWIVDRYRETPFLLRCLLLLGVILATCYAAYRFLFRFDTPSLDQLASRVEENYPEFDHRVVTALQLNRENAKTEGMSRQLIQEITKQTEELSEKHRFTSLAEYWRMRYSLAVLTPLALITGLLCLFCWPTVSALLTRQFLQNVEIPRSVMIENATTELWPSGDEVVVQVKAIGNVSESMTGSIRIQPEGQPTEDYSLKFLTHDANGISIFAATVPASTKPFQFWAWLGDGRLKKPGNVKFEPRPIVTAIDAIVYLPDFVGKNSEGENYTRYMTQAEVVALAESQVKVLITASKVLSSAEVVVSARQDSNKDIDVLRVPMQLTEANGVARFYLPPKATSYRIEVKDQNGFANSFPPKRGITIAPDEPPKVLLLAEVLKDPRDPGPIDDYDVTGMPLVLGGQVQIGFAARSPLGLRKAQIQYRVNDGEWVILPLKDTVANLNVVGKFVPELGVFENSGPFGQIEFYQIPSKDIENEPNGLEAGGRFNFQTAALKKRSQDGKQINLDVGDRVEFFVELFDRNPKEGRQGGRSESRLKTVVSQQQLDEWNRQRVQTAERLRMLEERQRALFRQPK